MNISTAVVDICNGPDAHSHDRTGGGECLSYTETSVGWCRLLAVWFLISVLLAGRCVCILPGICCSLRLPFYSRGDFITFGCHSFALVIQVLPLVKRKTLGPKTFGITELPLPSPAPFDSAMAKCWLLCSALAPAFWSFVWFCVVCAGCLQVFLLVVLLLVGAYGAALPGGYGAMAPAAPAVRGYYSAPEVSAAPTTPLPAYKAPLARVYYATGTRYAPVYYTTPAQQERWDYPSWSLHWPAWHCSAWDWCHAGQCRL